MSLQDPKGPSALERVASALLANTLAQRGDLLALKDAATGVYQHVNESMAAWIGRPAEEIVGATDAQLFDPELARLLRAACVTTPRPAAAIRAAEVGR